MSRFGAYLRKLLSERGVSISELARISGVERTSLQKSISGNRMLSRDAVEKVIWSLQLTPEEAGMLKYWYDVYFVGEDKYKSREIISGMLTNLASIANDYPSSLHEDQDFFSGHDIDFLARKESLISGKDNVKFLIESLLWRELNQDDPHVELTVPKELRFFNELLMYLYRKKKAKIKITQIISIHRNEEKESLNLHSIETFVNLLPVCLVSDCQYHPYYYYDCLIASLYTDPFPYFIVISDCVLCIAANGEKALLLNNVEYAKFYRKHFYVLLERCYAMVNYSENLASSVYEYSKVYDPEKMYVCIHQPCFAWECDMEMVRAKVRKNDPGWQETLEVFEDWMSGLKKVAMYHFAFNAEGLISFMEEGKVDAFPDFEKSIALEERIEILKKLILSVEEETKISARMFNEKIFTYPCFLTILTSEQKGVGIFTNSRFRNGVHPVYIYTAEPDVNKAFFDFMEALPVSEMTCSKEQTLKYLRSTLALYEKKLQESKRKDI